MHTRYLATAGMLLMATSMTWYSFWLVPDESLWWRLLLPSGLMGIGTAFTFSPISATATYNLAPADAGAGSGVYNSVRQVGAVLGSAAISALMQARLAATLPGGAGAGNRAEAAGRLPTALQGGSHLGDGHEHAAAGLRRTGRVPCSAPSSPDASATWTGAGHRRGKGSG